MDRFLKLYESSDLRLHELPFPRIAQQISMERSRSEEPGPAFHRAVEGFTSAGVFQMVRDDRAVLEQERDDLRSKLESFSGFVNKRTVLEEERRSALSSMAPARSVQTTRVAWFACADKAGSGASRLLPMLWRVYREFKR